MPDNRYRKGSLGMGIVHPFFWVGLKSIMMVTSNKSPMNVVDCRSRIGPDMLVIIVKAVNTNNETFLDPNVA